MNSVQLKIRAAFPEQRPQTPDAYRALMESAVAAASDAMPPLPELSEACKGALEVAIVTHVNQMFVRMESLMQSLEWNMREMTAAACVRLATAPQAQDERK